ncbi:MAG: prephenate dehydratase [Betaproteobacteria bacterium]|nr:MAG: prephenate dehydratase [Betaproteobacteria bacterium]
MATSLNDIRRKIDALDARLVQLLSVRARLAQQAWQAKGGTAAYKPEREAQVLRRVRELNKGPLSGAALNRLFTEIMSACRALEDQLAVAYLGPAGTFSEEAVIRHFGSATGSRPHASIDDVFRAVETGAAGYGVVPVENSTEGAVGRTLDLLLNTSARICGEVNLPVRQCLMSNARSRGAIRTVYSHTQSLGQCQQWLARHLPDVERIAVVSNAEAARLAGKDRSAAAIASRTAATLYGLKLLARNIEDDPKNTTRFAVIGAESAAPSGRDKTSLILSTRNVPGAVHDLLTPLAKHGVSMTRLESRPARTGRWEYVFYIDIEGHQLEPRVARALAALGRKAAYLKVLGSYPVAS